MKRAGLDDLPRSADASLAARVQPRPATAALTLLMLLPTASCVPSITSGVTHPVAMSAQTDVSLASDPATAAVLASFTAPLAAASSTDLPATPIVVPPGAAPAINASIALKGGANPAASAFFLRLPGAADRQRSLQCLTEAIYYEAASESDDGQRAVAQVVLNRVRHPAYPASVCGVVYQNAERWLACQFSFACDGARGRAPSAFGWARARTHAVQALAGRVHAPVGTATHYHNWNVVPFWAHKLEKNAVVGMHIFYRLGGALGRGAAFRQRHAGYEPSPVPLRFSLPHARLAFAPPFAAELASLPTPMALPPAMTAVPLPATETLTLPGSAPSPIMRAVESSTVRAQYRQSGSIRPEFARSYASSISVARPESNPER